MSKKKKQKGKKKDRTGKKDGKGAAREAAGCGKTGAAGAKGARGKECPGGKKCGKPREHLCRIAKRRDLDALRELVRDAAFLCAKCGRAAAGAKSLCKPVPI